MARGSALALCWLCCACPARALLHGGPLACQKSGGSCDARLQDCDFGLARPPPDRCEQKGGEAAVQQAYAEAAGCCNFGLKVGCKPGVCLCAPASAPAAHTQRYVSSQLPGLGELTARYARERLHRRRLLFIGDSTTRRLFYAVCAFLGEKIFADRHGPAHRSLPCPEEGWNDTLLQEAGIELAFSWAPTLNKLDALVPHLRGFADVVLTSIYHWNAYNGTKEDFPRMLAELELGKRLAAKLVVVAPNMLCPGADARSGPNPVILAVGIALEQLAGPGTAVVGNAWQATAAGERDACLGDSTGPGIHINNDCGQRLRAAGALAAALRLLEAT